MKYRFLLLITVLGLAGCQKFEMLTPQAPPATEIPEKQEIVLVNESFDNALDYCLERKANSDRGELPASSKLTSNGFSHEATPAGLNRFRFSAADNTVELYSKSTEDSKTCSINYKASTSRGVGMSVVFLKLWAIKQGYDLNLERRGLFNLTANGQSYHVHGSRSSRRGGTAHYRFSKAESE